jgi:hypothetical protein
MTHPNLLKKLFTFAASSCIALSSSNALAVDTITEAFKQGKPTLEMRYRFGYINDKAFSERAWPSTLRTALGYETAPYKGVSAKIVLNNVSGIGGLRYNDQVRPRNLLKPTEPDVTFTEVEQVYGKHSVLSFTDIYMGRREIEYGDERFISNTGWRQHHTTHDGIFVETSALSDTEVKLAYTRNVNTPFTEISSMGNLHGSFLLGYLKNKSYETMNVELFSYLLKFRPESNTENSTKTFGLTLSGNTKIFDDYKVGYLGQYAHQSDFKNNPNDFHFSYYRLEPSLTYYNLDLLAGYEYSQSNGTNAFSFIFSDTHKFNGWMDKFITMPSTGLVDYYAKVAYKISNDRVPDFINNTKFMFEYHVFKASKGDLGYGKEYDFGFVKPLNDNVKFIAMYMHYDAKNLSTAQSTDKVYGILSAKF